jgi:hypothetical protein
MRDNGVDDAEAVADATEDHSKCTLITITFQIQLSMMMKLTLFALAVFLLLGQSLLLLFSSLLYMGMSNFLGY